MFAKLSYTWALMGASWDVLRRTRGLLVFPLLSALCSSVVVASFVIPLAMTGAWRPPAGNADPAQKALYYAILFAFYFCTYAVTTFFNVAVVAGAVSRMTGGEPTVGYCFGEAAKRIHLIVGWALVSATVGLVLRVIEDRSPRVGQFVAGLLGAAWALVSFLVVPVLVVQNKGPIAALKESGSLLCRTWGEQLVGNFGFGLLFFLFALPGIAVLGLGAYALVALHNSFLGVFGIGLAVLYLIGLALVQSTLQAVFQAAVYLHTQGIHDHGFAPALMNGAIQTKD
jgi:hypothetical protein